MYSHPDIAERLVRERQRELLNEAAAERLAVRSPPGRSLLRKQRLRGWRPWLSAALKRRSLA